MKWKVVPLCDAQLMDVNKNDILNGGLYRKCNVYKSGGGYDRFPVISKSRFGIKYEKQFVVQLYGCPFSCPYCYVTKNGVFGKYNEIETETLINDFLNSKQEVFHLMGGAPAIYIENWLDIIDKIPDGKIFTSDIMLLENEKMWNNDELLKKLGEKRNKTLFAISIKGTDKKEFEKNTGQNIIKYDEFKIIERLQKLVDNNVNIYLTFTGCNQKLIERFENILYNNNLDNLLKDSFYIDIIEYDALKYIKNGGK